MRRRKREVEGGARQKRDGSRVTIFLATSVPNVVLCRWASCVGAPWCPPAILSLQLTVSGLTGGIET